MGVGGDGEGERLHRLLSHGCSCSRICMCACTLVSESAIDIKDRGLYVSNVRVKFSLLLLFTNLRIKVINIIFLPLIMVYSTHLLSQ